MLPDGRSESGGTEAREVLEAVATVSAKAVGERFVVLRLAGQRHEVRHRLTELPPYPLSVTELPPYHGPTEVPPYP